MTKFILHTQLLDRTKKVEIAILYLQELLFNVVPFIDQRFPAKFLHSVLDTLLNCLKFKILFWFHNNYNPPIFYKEVLQETLTQVRYYRNFFMFGEFENSCGMFYDMAVDRNGENKFLKRVSKLSEYATDQFVKSMKKDFKKLFDYIEGYLIILRAFAPRPREHFTIHYLGEDYGYMWEDVL